MRPDRRRIREIILKSSLVLFSFFAAFAFAVLLLFAFSGSFVKSLFYFFLGPFLSAYSFGNMLNAAVPLAIAGLGAALAFSSRSYNLGGEGQIYSGGAVSIMVCLALPGTSPLIVLPLAFAAGMAAGAAAGGSSGILKAGLGVNELLSSFLLSSAVIFLVDFLITGAFRDPASNFQTTRSIENSFRFPKILPPSNLNGSLFIAFGASLILAFVMKRTRFGYELKMFGKNPEFAKYCGMNTRACVIIPLCLSGALNGLAGASMAIGSQFKAMKGFSSGIGWTAIAVALVARYDPLAALPAALLFAYLEAGGRAAMIGSDVNPEIVALIQGLILFLVTAEALTEPLLKRFFPPTGAGLERGGGRT